VVLPEPFRGWGHGVPRDRGAEFREMGTRKNSIEAQQSRPPWSSSALPVSAGDVKLRLMWVILQVIPKTLKLKAAVSPI